VSTQLPQPRFLVPFTIHSPGRSHGGVLLLVGAGAAVRLCVHVSQRCLLLRSGDVGAVHRGGPCEQAPAGDPSAGGGPPRDCGPHHGMPESRAHHAAHLCRGACRHTKADLLRVGNCMGGSGELKDCMRHLWGQGWD